MTAVPQASSSALLNEVLEEVQTRTHCWGVKNQVQFDPSKEYFKILHPSLGAGEDFKLLGTLIDCKLTMLP